MTRNSWILALEIFVISLLIGFFSYRAFIGVTQLKTILDEHIKEHVNDQELRGLLNRHIASSAADLQQLEDQLVGMQKRVSKLEKRKPASQKWITNADEELRKRLDRFEESGLGIKVP